MPESYALVTDTESCEECGMCDLLLPGFQTARGGKILISSDNYQKEHVKFAVKSVIDRCPSNALSVVAASN
jgi:ferredoxin